MRNPRFLLAVLWLGLPVWAQTVILPPDRQAPNAPNSLQLKRLEVAVTIRDGVATTQVDHVFYNPGGARAEGQFLFALPDGAHLDGFSMWIGGVETHAELLDAGKARTIYTEIVRRQIDPALLEYAGNGLLSARVFPIEARGEKQVRLRYTQVVELDSGLRRYSWPLRACRRDNAPIEQALFKFELQTQQDLKTCFSPSHSLEVVRKGERAAVASFEAGPLLADRNFELLYSTGGDKLGLDLLTQSDTDGEFFWLTLVPALAQGEVVNRDIAFVVDTSGSMAGAKIEQARRALKFCIDHLSPGDRFNLVNFGTEANALDSAWLAADKRGRERAKTFVEGLQAIGGTNLEDALALVLGLEQRAERPRTLILLSDGKPTIGARDDAALLAQAAKLGKMRVFPVGIGFEVNTLLLDKLAENSGGWRTYVAPDEDLEIKLSALFQKISSPVLAQPKLVAEGVTLLETHPKQLPDLFRGTPLHLFGRFKGSGPAKLRLEGLVNGRQVALDYSVTFPGGVKSHGFIPGLWAQRRVGYLLDQIRLHGEEAELRDEVVRLARRYAIVTPYTSHLILEDDAPVPVVDVLRRDRPEASGVAHAPRGRRVSGVMALEPAGESAQKFSRAAQDLKQSEARPQQPPPMAEMEAQPPRHQLVAGRAFYLRGEVWVDSNLENVRTDKRLTLTYASAAYFAFMERHPETRAILALGERVSFFHDGTIVTVQTAS